MNKILKIALNLLVFFVTTGFIWYMIAVVGSHDKNLPEGKAPEKSELVSPYTLHSRFYAGKNMDGMELSGETLFIAAGDSIKRYTLQGEVLSGFKVENGIRDLAMFNGDLYILYPSKIACYHIEGSKINEWNACSDHSDYCAMAVAGGFVFVSDAQNKNICQYTTEGDFVRFLFSPNSFIIPSYSFGITVVGDTLYVSNSGRHKIESYTLQGEYITSFGQSGERAGRFAGCCNPVYITRGAQGEIITSEKGNPRISAYGCDGQFHAILLDAAMLGGGHAAYRVKAWSDMMVTAGANSVSVFRLNLALQ